MEISSKKNIVKNWFVILQDIITNDIEKLENKKMFLKLKIGQEAKTKEVDNFEFLKMVSFLRELV